MVSEKRSLGMENHFISHTSKYGLINVAIEYTTSLLVILCMKLKDNSHEANQILGVGNILLPLAL